MAMDILVLAGLVLLMVASVEAGFRIGRRARPRSESAEGGSVGAILGAMLGLLGLLLGFSFAGAGARFQERQHLIVDEANAIGTAYLRADLLDEPHRSALRASLESYLDELLREVGSLRNGVTAEMATNTGQLHDRMWKAAVEGAWARPATTEVVPPAVNEVIDLHSTRYAASRKHVPGLVLGLLIACSVICQGVIGYSCGFSGRRSLMWTGSLAILIAGTLWTTIDLDHGRAGFIRLSDAPLQALKLGKAR